jgi:hypothetical protein
MKTKLLALSCCLMTAFTVQAQTAEVSQPENKTYKPAAGDITTEVTVVLDYGALLNSGQLRGRKFMTDTKAFRLSVSLNGDYEKLEEEAYRSTFGLSIAPGIEKHFAGTNRLSPYIGADLPIGFMTSKYENEEVTIKNAHNRYGAERAYFNVGLRGLAGVDFYVAPRFYLGFEVGTGIMYRNYADVTTTYKYASFNDQEEKGYHSVRLYPFATGGIRLGFAF